MNLVKYEAFIKIHELGSITKVAKELGYSQPGISHMLDSLEAECGFPLLIRGKDSIRLTDNGLKILYYCKQAIENDAMLQETITQINGVVSGSISLGAISSTLVSFLSRLVKNFATAHPNIRMRIREDSVTGLKERLSSGEVDVAVTTSDIPEGFSFWPLFQDSLCLIMSKENPLASQPIIYDDFLNECDWIMPVSGWDDNVQLLQEVYPFQPRIAHYVASDTVAIAMAQENIGVYVLSKLQCSNLPDSVVVKEFAESVTRPIGIASKPIKTQTPAVKEFIKIARDTVNIYHTL